jgi:DMSO/TMAO reductase YedYZ molybdopterin-dependent catalytic subunit
LKGGEELKYLRRYWPIVLIVLIVALLASYQPTFGQAGQPGAEIPPAEMSRLTTLDPAHVDNSNFPITPTDKLHPTGKTPEIDIAEYRFVVEGLVEKPLSLTYDAILEYPTVTEVVLLICPETFVDNAEWTGIPVSTLLAEAGIKPEAKEIAFYAVDGYKQEFNLDTVQQEGVFLAHTVNGQTLPLNHGYPLRLVIRGEYGFFWVKWLERIEVK